MIVEGLNYEFSRAGKHDSEKKPDEIHNGHDSQNQRDIISGHIQREGIYQDSGRYNREDSRSVSVRMQSISSMSEDDEVTDANANAREHRQQQSKDSRENIANEGAAKETQIQMMRPMQAFPHANQSNSLDRPSILERNTHNKVLTNTDVIANLNTAQNQKSSENPKDSSHMIHTKILIARQGNN